MGEGAAEFRAAGLSMPVRLNGSAEGTPMRIAAGMSLPALRPTELATVWPPLAPLATLDALVSLSVTAELDAAARPERVRTTLTAGAGAFDLGPGPGPQPAGAAPRRLPFAGLAIAADITGRALALRQARLVLPGQGGLPGPALDATGEILHRDAGWEIALDLAASPLEASDLPRLWPAALAPEARTAALGALPAGLLRDTRLRGRFRLRDPLGYGGTGTGEPRLRRLPRRGGPRPRPAHRRG